MSKTRAEIHLECKRRWLHFQRQVWGTSELKRFDVAKSKVVGRVAEVLARDQFLPASGFSDIDDWSGHSNQFFCDFVATKDGKRVLVDATVRLKAHIPEKVKLARSLGMALFIIHVAPTGKLFYINEVQPGRKVTRVPAAFIRKHAV